MEGPGPDDLLLAGDLPWNDQTDGTLAQYFTEGIVASHADNDVRGGKRLTFDRVLWTGESCVCPSGGNGYNPKNANRLCSLLKCLYLPWEQNY